MADDSDNAIEELTTRMAALRSRIALMRQAGQSGGSIATQLGNEQRESPGLAAVGDVGRSLGAIAASLPNKALETGAAILDFPTFGALGLQEKAAGAITPDFAARQLARLNQNAQMDLGGIPLVGGALTDIAKGLYAPEAGLFTAPFAAADMPAGIVKQALTGKTHLDNPILDALTDPFTWMMAGEGVSKAASGLSRIKAIAPETALGAQRMAHIPESLGRMATIGPVADVPVKAALGAIGAILSKLAPGLMQPRGFWKELKEGEAATPGSYTSLHHETGKPQQWVPVRPEDIHKPYLPGEVNVKSDAIAEPGEPAMRPPAAGEAPGSMPAQDFEARAKTVQDRIDFLRKEAEEWADIARRQRADTERVIASSPPTAVGKATTARIQAEKQAEARPRPERPPVEPEPEPAPAATPAPFEPKTGSVPPGTPSAADVTAAFNDAAEQIAQINKTVKNPADRVKAIQAVLDAAKRKLGSRLPIGDIPIEDRIAAHDAEGDRWHSQYEQTGDDYDALQRDKARSKASELRDAMRATGRTPPVPGYVHDRIAEEDAMRDLRADRAKEKADALLDKAGVSAPAMASSVERDLYGMPLEQLARENEIRRASFDLAKMKVGSPGWIEARNQLDALQRDYSAWRKQGGTKVVNKLGDATLPDVPREPLPPKTIKEAPYPPKPESKEDDAAWRARGEDAYRDHQQSVQDTWKTWERQMASYESHLRNAEDIHEHRSTGSRVPKNIDSFLEPGDAAEEVAREAQMGGKKRDELREARRLGAQKRREQAGDLLGRQPLVEATRHAQEAADLHEAADKHEDPHEREKLHAQAAEHELLAHYLRGSDAAKSEAEAGALERSTERRGKKQPDDAMTQQGQKKNSAAIQEDTLGDTFTTPEQAHARDQAREQFDAMQRGERMPDEVPVFDDPAFERDQAVEAAARRAERHGVGMAKRPQGMSAEAFRRWARTPGLDSVEKHKVARDNFREASKSKDPLVTPGKGAAGRSRIIETEDGGGHRTVYEVLQADGNPGWADVTEHHFKDGKRVEGLTRETMIPNQEGAFARRFLKRRAVVEKTGKTVDTYGLVDADTRADTPAGGSRAIAAAHAKARDMSAKYGQPSKYVVESVTHQKQGKQVRTEATMTDGSIHSFMSSKPLGKDEVAIAVRKREQAGATVAERKPSGFSTSRGSTYKYEPNGGTSRKKFDGSVHGASDRTVFVSEDHADDLLDHARMAAFRGDARIARHTGDANNMVMAYTDPKGNWIDKSGKKIEFSDHPEVGKVPLELWEGPKERYGNGVYRAFHVGHPIDKIDYEPGSAEAADHPPTPPADAPTPKAGAPFDEADVRAFMKQGHSREEATEYAKIVNGWKDEAPSVPQGTPVNYGPDGKLKYHPLSGRDNRYQGWKIHLNVAREAGEPGWDVTQRIHAYLDQRGIKHKIGMDGDQAGKGMTIYVGDKKSLDMVAQDLHSRFGKELPAAGSDVMNDDRQLIGNVWGRFAPEPYRDWKYGKNGIPMHVDDAAARLWHKVEQKQATMRSDGITRGKAKAIPDPGPAHPPSLDEAVARADATLRKQYGDFYTGEAAPEAPATPSSKPGKAPRKGKAASVPAGQATPPPAGSGAPTQGVQVDKVGMAAIKLKVGRGAAAAEGKRDPLHTEGPRTIGEARATIAHEVARKAFGDDFDEHHVATMSRDALVDALTQRGVSEESAAFAADALQGPSSPLRSKTRPVATAAAHSTPTPITANDDISKASKDGGGGGDGLDGQLGLPDDHPDVQASEKRFALFGAYDSPNRRLPVVYKPVQRAYDAFKREALAVVKKLNDVLGRAGATKGTAGARRIFLFLDNQIDAGGRRTPKGDAQVFRAEHPQAGQNAVGEPGALTRPELDAANHTRTLLDSLAERQNMPERGKYRRDYVPYIRALKESLQTRRRRWLYDGAPDEVRAWFDKARNEADLSSSIQDIHEALGMYVPLAIKKIHFEPVLDRLVTYDENGNINGGAIQRAYKKDPARYAESMEYVKSVLGVNKGALGADQQLASMFASLREGPLGAYFGEASLRPATKIALGLTRAAASSYLGLRPWKAFTNIITGQFNTLMTMARGHEGYTAFMKNLATGVFRLGQGAAHFTFDELSNRLGGGESLAAQADVMRSYHQYANALGEKTGLWGRINQAGMSLHNLAEYINRGIAFHAGLMEHYAKPENGMMPKEGPSKEALLHAQNVADESQFALGLTNRSPYLQGPKATVSMQFANWQMQQLSFTAEQVANALAGLAKGDTGKLAPVLLMAPTYLSHFLAGLPVLGLTSYVISHVMKADDSFLYNWLPGASWVAGDKTSKGGEGGRIGVGVGPLGEILTHLANGELGQVLTGLAEAMIPMGSAIKGAIRTHDVAARGGVELESDRQSLPERGLRWLDSKTGTQSAVAAYGPISRNVRYGIGADAPLTPGEELLVLSGGRLGRDQALGQLRNELEKLTDSQKDYSARTGPYSATERLMRGGGEQDAMEGFEDTSRRLRALGKEW